MSCPGVKVHSLVFSGYGISLGVGVEKGLAMAWRLIAKN